MRSPIFWRKSFQQIPSASYQHQGGEPQILPNMEKSQNEFASRDHEPTPFSATISSVQTNARVMPVKTTRTTASTPTASLTSCPFRNRTNIPSATSNFLLQTILKESQQVKAEYRQYKNETQAKLLEQETIIGNLKDNANLYQKKILELKLQKEVYVAREVHTFQEIQDSIQELLKKVSMFARTESMKEGTRLRSEAVSDSPFGLSYSDIAANLKNFENRLADLEKNSKLILLSNKATEENMTLQASLTNQKLDQIMFQIMGNGGLCSSETTTPRDTDVSLYNASAEDNLDDSDTNDIHAIMPDGVGGIIKDQYDIATPSKELEPETKVNDNAIYEVPMLPIQIVLHSRKEPSSFPNKNKIRGQHRKRKVACNSASLRKRMCRRMRRGKVSDCQNDMPCVEKKCSDGDASSEKPPVLSLPVRISRVSQTSSQPMPVLIPEDRKTFQQNKVERKIQEHRKDDALIGIKKENVSTELHGKDFSKMGYVCLCGAKFTGAGGLYVHQVKTMENEKFSCRSCGKKFHYFSGLKAHRKSAHKQEFTQEVGCSRCGQIFKSKRDRQGHLDDKGQTCWLSGSYQSKDWEAIRSKRNLSLSSSSYSSSPSSSQNANV